MSNWANALQDLLQHKQEPIPKGFQSCEEIARELQLCVSHTRYKLRELVAAGKAEKISVRRSCSKGLASHTFYRRLK